jgi:hypothetical protein
MDHEARSNVGCVDGAAGRAATRLGFNCRKESCPIVISTELAGGHKNADHFAQHAPIRKELCTVADSSPDRTAGLDRIDTAKHCFADRELWSKAVIDQFNFDRVI